MEPKIVKQGYVVITPTLCQGNRLAWSSQKEGEEVHPLIFNSVRDAQLEIIELLEDNIQQFKDGERDWEDIGGGLEDEFIAEYIEYEDGAILIYDLDDTDKIPIIETTLSKWRNNL